MSFITRRVVTIASDLLVVNAALFLAFFLRFDLDFFYANIFNSYLALIAPISVIRLCVFYFFGLQDWSFRYAGLSDALRLFAAVSIGSVGLIAFVAFFHFQEFRMQLGRSVLVIDYLLCLVLIGCSRYSFRIFLKLDRRIKARALLAFLPNTLIVGAGDAGEMIARELLKGKNRSCRIVGFIDDDANKRNIRIHGIKVLGSTHELDRIVELHQVEEIILAIPAATGKTIRSIIDRCQNKSIQFKILPDLESILSGRASIKEIRDVSSEDLLDREVVQINGKEVGDLIRNKVVLISGAGGSIGSELCRQVAAFHPRLLLLFDIVENDVYFLGLELMKKNPLLRFKTIIGDIRDIGLLKNTFSVYRPQIVFHAAAHKHVPLMEENPVAAVKNNVLGTRNLVYAAHHYRTEKFVLISSDKAVNPSSIMGTTKRIAEMLVQAKAAKSKTKFMAVRFGNVLGSKGSVIPLFKKQIEEGGPLTVTHPEMRRYFMSLTEAAQLVVQAAAIGRGAEIFILDMGEQIKIMDLARNLITLSGLEIDKDVSIKCVGLRPGEKLYEEILLEKEHDGATKSDKIFVAAADKTLCLKNLRKKIAKLEWLARTMQTEKIQETIHAIIMDPESVPSNSRLANV